MTSLLAEASVTSRLSLTGRMFPRKRGSCVGLSRAGWTTKAISNKHGFPIALILLQETDTLTEPTIDSAFVDEVPLRLIADKAWDSAKHQEILAARGIQLIAPTRRGKRVSRRQQYGRPLRRYKRRWMLQPILYPKNFRHRVLDGTERPKTISASFTLRPPFSSSKGFGMRSSNQAL